MKIKKTEVLTYFLKNFFVCALIIFLGIYISLSSGNTNYKAYNQNKLTEEKIKQFEEDVKNGVNIDLENYIVTTDNISSNKISKAGTYLSEKITNITKKMIKTIAKIFEFIFAE